MHVYWPKSEIRKIRGNKSGKEEKGIKYASIEDHKGNRNKDMGICQDDARGKGCTVL